MSRDLNTLAQCLQPVAHTFADQCAERGLPIRFTHTRRTDAEQQALYDQGRTTPGRIVTHAKPGQSPHNFGLAFDVVFLDTTTQAPWDITWDLPGREDEWEAIGAIGEALGLVWGGRWKTPDRPHFEWPNWRTVAKEL